MRRSFPPWGHLASGNLTVNSWVWPTSFRARAVMAQWIWAQTPQRASLLRLRSYLPLTRVGHWKIYGTVRASVSHLSNEENNTYLRLLWRLNGQNHTQLWFSIRDDFVPPGTFGNVWRRFWMSQLEQGGFQHLVGRRQGSCYDAHREPHTTKHYLAPNVNNAEVENPWVKWWSNSISEVWRNLQCLCLLVLL